MKSGVSIIISFIHNITKNIIYILLNVLIKIMDTKSSFGHLKGTNKVTNTWNLAYGIHIIEKKGP